MNNYQNHVIKTRNEFLKLVQRTEKEILNTYINASKLIDEKLKRIKKGSATEAYLKQLDKALKEYTIELRTELSNKVKDSISEGVQLAFDLNSLYVDSLNANDEISKAFKNKFISLNKEVVQQMVSGAYYKDGKTLDDRIWNLTKKNAKDIEELIRTNLAKGANAKELAKLVDKYSKNKIARKNLADGMNKKLSYQATRLARTSLTHAFNETLIRETEANPFAKGIKWNLSGSHYSRQVKKWGKDICDEYANQNNYGLGKGVFRTNETPIAHPNCLCYLTVETVPIKEARKELIDWVNGEENSKLDEFLE